MREHADHAGAPHSGGHLVAKRAQAFRDDPGRTMLGEGKFRMSVQVAVKGCECFEVRTVSHREPPWRSSKRPHRTPGPCCSALSNFSKRIFSTQIPIGLIFTLRLRATV